MTVRRGRVTKAQRRALDHLLPKYDFFSAPFATTAPLGVEIGFGMGEALAQWAVEAPEWNLLGIEIYPSGVGALLNRLEEQELSNVRVAHEPAELLLAEHIKPGSVQELRILFPDPWPKKRHTKRRLLQHSFVRMLAESLSDTGELYVATDWAPYAEWALEQLSAEPLLQNLADGFSVRDDRRVVTKFEARGKRLGHDIYDLRFRRHPET